MTFEDQENLEFIHNFKEWMSKSEFNIESESHLKLINSPNKSEGRCIISTADYPEDTLIYKISYKHLINYRKTLKHPDLVEYFEWSLENLKSYKLTRMDALYIYLISQRFDIDSDLHGFVNSMPITYDTPEYFDKSLIQLLPDHLATLVRKRILNLENKFTCIKESLCLFTKFQKDKTSKSIQILIENFSESNFRWAFNSVNSRCFYLDDAKCDVNELSLANRLFGALEKRKKRNAVSFQGYLKSVEHDEDVNNNMCCLIPYVDMLNHSLRPNGSFYFDPVDKSYVLKSAKLNDETSSCLIKKGEQVYITYGAHDNRTLLIEYGFFLDANIYDKITLNEEDFRELISNEKLLTNLWIEVNRHSLLLDLSIFGEGPSWSVLKVLDLIFQMNQCESKKEKKKVQKVSASYDIISSSNEIKTLYLRVLNRYETQFKLCVKSLEDLKLKWTSEDPAKPTLHLDMVLKYSKLQLDLIDANFLLVNDDNQWNNMF